MKSVNLIFPHQLFKDSPLFKSTDVFYLVEEYLFFSQYPFHKQKIAFHRASMRCYLDYLTEQKGLKVVYIEAHESLSDVGSLIRQLQSEGVDHVNYIDPVDHWLGKRISASLRKNNMSSYRFDSPLFLNSKADLSSFFAENKVKFHQTSFYKQQRMARNILMDDNQKPVGGKLTFDSENRLKYPKNKLPPVVRFPSTSSYYLEAVRYTNKYFKGNLGSLSEQQLYPVDFKDTKAWVEQFYADRFAEFGSYEDAIVQENSILNHSVFTPMLNVGLVTPQEVLDSCLKSAKKNDVPINSVEGFVRQIMGWREFIRGVYELKGVEERTTNFWKFNKKIPASFYDGSTGILPVDQTIKKILKTGYCHHIERLMVLGNFMLLCEFDPDEVYKWFMELFIDSYDWVMVPNVYGMSQFADGGLMSTKPYVSGSNYLIKMSNYKKGPWQVVWDGLFWRFMNKQRAFFLSNPRLGMLVRMFDKMPMEKQEQHLSSAETYLNELSKQVPA